MTSNRQLRHYTNSLLAHNVDMPFWAERAHELAETTEYTKCSKNCAEISHYGHITCMADVG